MASKYFRQTLQSLLKPSIPKVCDICGQPCKGNVANAVWSGGEHSTYRCKTKECIEADKKGKDIRGSTASMN